VQGPEMNAKRHADHLTVFCPSTHGSIQTTIATDVQTLAKAWHSKIKVSCPHCGEYRPQFHTKVAVINIRISSNGRLWSVTNGRVNG